MAPFERDAARWFDMPWWNRYSGREYRLTGEPFGGFVRPGVVRPRTYREVLVDYLANPEAKSLRADGSPCMSDTTGLLGRRRVRLKTVSHVGKESNQLEDVQTGLVENHSDVVNSYDDVHGRVFLPLVVPVLRRLGVRETARRTGHGLGAVSAALSGRSTPRRAAIERYVEAAAAAARSQLSASGREPLDDPIACIRLVRDLQQ